MLQVGGVNSHHHRTQWVKSSGHKSVGTVSTHDHSVCPIRGRKSIHFASLNPHVCVEFISLLISSFCPPFRKSMLYRFTQLTTQALAEKNSKLLAWREYDSERWSQARAMIQSQESYGPALTQALFKVKWIEESFTLQTPVNFQAYLLLSKSPCLHHQLMWPPGKCWVKRNIKGEGIPVPFTLFSGRLWGLNAGSLNNLALATPCRVRL